MTDWTTPRKRARGLGAAHSGTHGHWLTIVTSLALLVLAPAFAVTFGAILGGSYEEARAAVGHPLVAVVFALTLGVGLVHFRHGVQVMLEDYAHGLARQLLIAGAICVSYALLAAGLLAVARLAF